MINKIILKGQVYKIAKVWKAKKGLTKCHGFFFSEIPDEKQMMHYFHEIQKQRTIADGPQ